MPLRQPKRTEAKVWLSQFNQHLGNWLASGRSEEEHLREAVSALQSMLEREPEVAEMVSNICANLLYQHSSVIRPKLIEDLARLGLDAEQMRSDEHPLRWAERAVLRLALARAAQAQHQRFAALRGLAAIQFPTLDEQSPAGCLRRYLGANVDSELADLHESGLDRQKAREHAASVVEACDWLVSPEKKLALLLRGLTDLFYAGVAVPDQVLQGLLQLTWTDLSSMEVRNAVRMARCAVYLTPGGASSPEVAELVERAIERITQRGVADLTGVDLIAFFRQAPDELSHRIIEKVTASAQSLGIDPGSFDTVLPAAAAAYVFASPEVREEYLQAAAGLEQSEDPVTRAVGLGLLVVAESRDGGDEEPAHGDAFLRALDKLISGDEAIAHDWRIQAELDEPIGVLVRAGATRFKAAKPADRLRLARLLDSLRVAPSLAQAWLSSVADGVTDRRCLARARHLAEDLFGRLVFALRSWPDAVAITLQETRGQTLFVCATGKGIQVFESGAEFRQAATAAASCLAEQMETLSDLHIPPDDRAVESAGRAAFEAMPEGVRKLVAKSQVVLFCPDYRANTDATPLELLHDGKEWLGISRVVARLPSLEAMVRAAEGSRRRVLEKRLLAIAVARPKGHEPLPEAEREIAAVRSSLAEAGWDAPEIEESRVDPDFILNRTSFAAHMHIAAHGEAGGAEEALVLSRGTHLMPEDVASGSYGCTPTLWLNTCDLAQTTYLGAGAVRGVAQAFLEAGSPAVIANLLPVDDEASSRLAQRFYAHAEEQDFGESLRRARQDMVAEGMSPVLWGSTVLLGDARVTLRPSPEAPAEWQNVLSHAIAQRDDPRQLAAAAEALEQEAQGSKADLRLLCAAGIVHALEQASEESTPDDPALLADVCRLSLRLQAHDTAALVAYHLSEVTVDADPAVALAVTRGAIGLLRPVEAMNPEWRRLTDRLLVRAEQLRRGERAFRTRQIGEFFMETKLAIDLRSRWYGLSPVPRQQEESSEDILWNAVMAARTKSFEDMPETIAYARHVAEKLAAAGELPRERAAQAAVMLAGLLKWMWDRQNIVAVEREVVESQTRVAQLALTSFLTNWSPDEPWLKLVADYSADIERWLGALDALPYDGKLYVAMNQAMDRIRDTGLERLHRVETQYPTRCPDAIVYLLGTLIETNTYSFTEGSVPEDICEKLKGVHHELSMKAEGYLMPWLMEGFRAVREAIPDELQRWLYFEANMISP